MAHHTTDKIFALLSVFVCPVAACCLQFFNQANLLHAPVFSFDMQYHVLRSTITLCICAKLCEEILVSSLFKLAAAVGVTQFRSANSMAFSYNSQACR